MPAIPVAAVAEPYRLAGMDAPNAAAATAPMTTAEMLARLVAFDTTSRNSNLKLIEFVRGYLDAGVSPIASAPMRPGKRPTSTPSSGRSLPAGSRCPAMSIPCRSMVRPGAPTRSACAATGGNLYARGACDMKGFVAACLAAVPDFQAQALARPLHLFISYDEETGGEGVERLIADLRESGLKPALCVVGEPSGMKPILAHKGKLNLEVRVRGLPGHSSEPARASTPSTPPARRLPMSPPKPGGWPRKARSRRASSRRTPPSMSARCRAARSSTSFPNMPNSSWSGATSPATTRSAMSNGCRRSSPRISNRRCTRCTQRRGFSYEVLNLMPGMALRSGPRTDRGSEADHRAPTAPAR